MSKTIPEINERIRNGQAVVVTAEEMIDLVDEKGTKKAAQDVDVVTTGTFGPMCSSGMYINIGHPEPRFKFGGGNCYLNDVLAYTGLAAVDLYLGATALPDDDPLNKNHPGEFRYGGGHVVQDFVAGRDIRLVAAGGCSDCYPRKRLETLINIRDVNEAVLFNPRNAYQNYNVAVNLSDRKIYTYMGVLKSNMGNANYCSAGQLSPLMNDPLYRTIGIGTRIFLGGGVGYVAWSGTQHNPGVKRKDNDVPCVSAATLALIGDLKQMSAGWLVGASLLGYGASLYVGVGIPIPVLDEDVARHASVKDKDIFAPIVDYGEAYPQRLPETLGEVSYAELKSGKITVQGKEVPTASLSSYPKAREIAQVMKDWIQRGEFLLTEAVSPIPGPDSGISLKPMEVRPITNSKGSME